MIRFLKQHAEVITITCALLALGLTGLLVYFIARS